jgi:hypothetical protein
VSCVHPERSCRVRAAVVGGFLAAVAVSAGPAGLVSWPGAVLAAYLVLTLAVLTAVRRSRSAASIRLVARIAGSRPPTHSP